MTVNEVDSQKRMNIIIAANHISNVYSNHDPFHIAHDMGASIHFPTLNSGIKAFSTYGSDGLNIYIDKRLDSFSRKMMCFHELGHFFLEDGYYGALFDKTIDPEKEFLCNIFMTILFPQVETRLMSNGDTDINYINDYFDHLTSYVKSDIPQKGEIAIFNDTSTIFNKEFT